MDLMPWRPGQVLSASRLEKTRQSANTAGNMQVETPLTIHDYPFGTVLRFDQSYGKLRWGKILRQSDIIASDNYCYLHPCVDSDASSIVSDTRVKCYFTTPIGTYCSDVRVASDEMHLYRPFGGDNKGILINPRTSGLIYTTTAPSDTITLGSDVYVSYTSEAQPDSYDSDDLVGCRVYFTTRVYYDHTSANPELYGFQREVQVTPDRRIFRIGPEVRYSIDIPSDCA